MNRRDFLKTAAITVGASTLTGCHALQNLTSSNKLPNIIIIYADDMGYGDLACQNPDSKIPTPNLDKLAAQGVRFTDGHSSSGICTPSRYALLTGRYHWRDFHGIVNAFGPPRFESKRLTLPEMLKTKGYKTACVGKWHLGWDWEAIKNPDAEQVVDGRRRYYRPDAFDWTKPVPGGPTDHGFDYYFGDGTINFPPYCWVENDKILDPPTEDLKLKDEKPKEGSWEFRQGPMTKDWDPYKVLPTLSDKTVEYVNQQKPGRPFFLYFALPSPHAPIIPNDEFDGKSQAGPYGDFVYQSDHVAGKLLDALKEKGLDENTIVIFTADNGPEHYAYPRVKKFDHNSVGKLRGLKRDIFQGGHRVPFLIRWPDKIAPNRVNDALISQIDIMATIAQITGCRLGDNAAEDSFNILPTILDNTDATPARSSHVHNTYEDKYAIRKDNWVLVDHKSGHMTRVPKWYIEKENLDMNMPNGGLYNLTDDIGERKNLIDDHPEKAAELRTLLKQIRDAGHSAPRLQK